MIFMNVMTPTVIDPIAKLAGESFQDNWLASITVGSILIRLILSVFFGGMIGVERATKNHAAGFRTYILVCMGATIAMITNQFLYTAFETGDVARLGAQVISGIGFLGAGTIIVTSRSQIRGLTTAAGLWACACVGLSIGIGFYTLSIISIIIILLSLTIFTKVENHFTRKSRRFELHLELDARTHLKDFISYIRLNDMRIRSIEHNPAYASSGLSVYTVLLDVHDAKVTHQEVIDGINVLDYVNHVEEI